ncbi:DUF2946 family protein [Pararhizobium haloflavum]|uniref:DUF2946 family protein n=1 Tax=Pararhizobium haloflavum TaxID=2037914 RepID=UPI000C1793BB|nr:DUF2946 family protein [Pararhizobium haloflavum]
MRTDWNHLEKRARQAIFIVLLAYLMAFQGAVSLHARTAMAASGDELAEIICSKFGTSDRKQDHPLKDLTHDCCALLCQSAGGIAHALAPQSLVYTHVHQDPALRVFWTHSTRDPPPSPILHAEARAPPFFVA